MRTPEQRMGEDTLYVFRNELKSLLKVPAPPGSGDRRIAPGNEFIGDYSLMRFVRFGMASVVREITSSEHEPTTIDRFVNKVFHGDALKLLRILPAASVDAVITDPMYGTAKNCLYDWGPEPAKGDPEKHWFYHEPIYQECRRVLKPGSVLAWAQGFKFVQHFEGWFGDHRVWSPICTAHGLNFTPNTWVVQMQEQQPIDHPNNMIVRVDRNAFLPLKELHPCPKTVEEMLFMVSHLTQPGQVVLDCFSGLGSTLLAAKQLGRRWIGCDLSKRYGQWAMKRLAEFRRLGPARENLQIELHLKPKPFFVPNGGNQSWQTPPNLFEKLHSIFQFTVDAAASEVNALLPRYWAVEHDALRQDWSNETVFCNPPFNNIAPFLVKARTAKKALVLVWLNVLTSPYFLDQSADFIIIPKGRVKYINTSRRANPYFATCFLLYGKLTPREAVAIISQGWQYYLKHKDVPLDGMGCTKMVDDG